MLDELVIENNNWFLRTYVGIYEGNIKISYILGYELYDLYKKYRGNMVNDREWLLSHLPIGNYMHRRNKDSEYFLD